MDIGVYKRILNSDELGCYEFLVSSIWLIVGSKSLWLIVVNVLFTLTVVRVSPCHNRCSLFGGVSGTKIGLSFGSIWDDFFDERGWRFDCRVWKGFRLFELLNN